MNRREAIKISGTSLAGVTIGFLGGRLSTTIQADNMLENVKTTATTTAGQTTEKMILAISDSKQFYHYHIELARRRLISLGYDIDQSFLDVARGREAFATRRAQLVSLSPIFLMSLAEQGEKVLFGPSAYINMFVIVVRKDFDEKSLSRPLNVGISMLTSTGHYFATLFLKEMNITEVNWVQIGRSRERIAALVNGNIDLSAVQYDEAFNAIVGGADIKILGRPKSFWTMFGLYEELVEQNSELVKDLIKSLILAKVYCRGDRERHINESIKYAEYEPSPEIIKLARETYEFYDQENFWTTIVPPDSFFEELFQWSVENKVIEGKVDYHSLSNPVKELVDSSLEELMKG